MSRPSWDDYFLDIARAVAQRGDCLRDQVGAVIVDSNHRIVGTGYNGVPAGEKGCIEQPCLRVERSAEERCPGYSDCRSTHAEANALLYADQRGVIGGTIYITRVPCSGCLKLIAVAQIARVVCPGVEYVSKG